MIIVELIVFYICDLFVCLGFWVRVCGGDGFFFKEFYFVWKDEVCV